MKIIYLAGPINGCSDSDANDWRSEVKERLSGLYEFLDPMRHDYRGREMEPGIAGKIVGDDMADVMAADILFANCPKPSVGTSMEIFYAFDELKKTVVVVAPQPLSPWLKRFSTVQYANLGAAITYLRTTAKR